MPAETRADAIVVDVIRSRRTQKILAAEPIPLSPQLRDQWKQVVWDCIETAGWAPFHYDRAEAGVAEPWRFYMLDATACRTLSKTFHQRFDDLKPGNKLPAMLNACGCLVLVTWLPQPSHTRPEKLRQVNEEHLAATAAAIQNLLLLLESHGLGSYWSSGGPLGSQTFFRSVGIGETERLAGAIFVHYPGLADDSPVKLEKLDGKNRVKRGPMRNWASELGLSE